MSRFPLVAEALGRVLDIHELVGSGTTDTAFRLSSDPNGTTSSDAAFPEVGQTIAGFFLVEELGRGSFARVFLARERQLADRPVALKVTRRGSREPQTLRTSSTLILYQCTRIKLTLPVDCICSACPISAVSPWRAILADPDVQVTDQGAALAEALDRLRRNEDPALRQYPGLHQAPTTGLRREPTPRSRPDRTDGRRLPPVLCPPRLPGGALGWPRLSTTRTIAACSIAILNHPTSW